MPTPEQIEKAARAICVTLGLRPDECTFGSGGIVHGGNSSFTCHRYRWQEFSAHASAALSAAEGVNVRELDSQIEKVASFLKLRDESVMPHEVDDDERRDSAKAICAIFAQEQGGRADG